MHERNEGRHHNGDALPCALPGNGGYLVTQAFAAASGHEHQGVVSAGDVLDDGLLRPSERLIAKYLAEDTQNVGWRVQNGRGWHEGYCPPCQMAIGERALFISQCKCAKLAHAAFRTP
jgi:hypothetical protein